MCHILEYILPIALGFNPGAMGFFMSFGVRRKTTKPKALLTSGAFFVYMRLMLRDPTKPLPVFSP
jgi:NAD kinase